MFASAGMRGLSLNVSCRNGLLWLCSVCVCVEFNLRDLLILASLLVGIAEDDSPELLNECDIPRNAILTLFNEVTLTLAVLFQFSFIYIVTFR